GRGPVPPRRGPPRQARRARRPRRRARGGRGRTGLHDGLLRAAVVRPRDGRAAFVRRPRGVGLHAPARRPLLHGGRRRVHGRGLDPGPTRRRL
ncbi:MAG: hypothetical protein AVDCRST_MAG53-1440, partial [uncultured Solirubrobacteraceae bacterium]